MSELTKEDLDQKLDSLATKKDLGEQTQELKLYVDKKVDGLVQGVDDKIDNLAKSVDDKIDNLARMVAAGFEEVRNLLDVRERVEHLEIDLNKIKKALHI